MIKLSNLAQNIEKILNDKLQAEKEKENGIHIDTPRGGYKFRIVADTSDYKQAEREGNNITFYIQGILHQVDSNIEASQGGKISATLNTRLDILAPVFDGTDEDGNKELVKSVREILDACFASSGAGVIGNDSYSYKYSLVNTGTRSQLPMVGDAFIFTAYINYYFVENGINSQNISLRINGHVVPYTALGINRSTTQEANLPADTIDGAAQNANSSTLVSVNFVAPYRNTPAFDAIKNYVYLGTNNRMEVTISQPNKAKMFYMCINEAQINCETVLNASVSATLSEMLVE